MRQANGCAMSAPGRRMPPGKRLRTGATQSTWFWRLRRGACPIFFRMRHGRMVRSAFTFYRGAALTMASDLASTPSTGLHVQCCGDAHLCNFGGFATPERRILFAINDLDETNPAPWEWDVKRLAASFVVACRDQGSNRCRRQRFSPGVRS